MYARCSVIFFHLHYYYYATTQSYQSLAGRIQQKVRPKANLETPPPPPHSRKNRPRGANDTHGARTQSGKEKGGWNGAGKLDREAVVILLS